MLTLQFVPYNDIESLSSAKRVTKLIDIVMQNKIVLLEGMLKKEEEKDLIEITMEKIDKKFKGIELAVVDPELKDANLIKKAKNTFVGILLGDRRGFTIIGPASVIKEIKKDPEKIELLTKETRTKRKKRKK